MATQPIDYAALAKQANEQAANAPAVSAPVDYAALAAQANKQATGATEPTKPEPAKGFWSSLGTSLGNQAKSVAKAALPVDYEDAKDAMSSLGKGDYGDAALSAGKSIIRGTPVGKIARIAENAGKGAADQGKQAVGYVKAGRPSEAVGHGVAAALPMVGPMVANWAEQAGGEPSMPQVNQVGPQREQDVMGALGTATGDVGPALAAGGAVRGMPSVGDYLKESSTKSYSKALGPTTRANKAITTRIAPELAERGEISMSRKGIQSKAAGNVEAVGSQIGEAFDNLPPDASVPLNAVLDNLDATAQNSFTVQGVPGVVPKGPLATTGIKNVQKLGDTLAAVAEKDPATGEMVVPVSRVRQLRQYFDKVAAKSGRYGVGNLADESMAEAHGMAADAIRNELAKQYPDIAALNKEYSFWKNVHSVASDTIDRTASQSVPIGQQIGSAVGGAAGFTKGGPLGAAKGAMAGKALVGVFKSPLWQTTSAVVKNKMANALAKGDASQANAIAAAVLAGSASQEQRSFPNAKIEAFAQMNGITADEAKKRLAAEGWQVQ